MQTTYLLLSFTLLISSVAATLTLFETKELMEKNERCLFSSCLRETSYLSNKHQTVVHKKLKETEPPLKVEDTLAHQASKTSASLTAYSAVMTGIKLVAKFFHTTETTETTENYWDELRDTISAMVDYALDDSILQQTNAAVEMLSEDLQLYLDVSNTTGGAFSAIALCQKMDTQLINILATYSGMSMKERGVLHYLDMATTRLMLWQTTAFRYIADYTVHGQLDSGMMVCDIVRKWSLAYDSETRLIREDQMTALTDWVSNFVDELDLSCSRSCHEGFPGNWDKTLHCKVHDGYHNLQVKDAESTCSDHSCPSCDFVCFNYCQPDLMKPFIKETQTQFQILAGHITNTLQNYFAMQVVSLDKYKEDCGIL